MTPQIIESGMTFGPYPPGSCFHIEKSTLYTGIRQGVKMAEFSLLRAGNDGPALLWIVEAKSSSPQPEKAIDLSRFLSEVKEKWLNALSLTLASCLGRHRLAEVDLPEPFKRLNLHQFDVRFVLVINGHKKSWLPPIQEVLRNELRSVVRTWHFAPTSVVVLNDALAKKHRLIC